MQRATYWAKFKCPHFLEKNVQNLINLIILIKLNGRINRFE